MEQQSKMYQPQYYQQQPYGPPQQQWNGSIPSAQPPGPYYGQAPSPATGPPPPDQPPQSQQPQHPPSSAPPSSIPSYPPPPPQTNEIPSQGYQRAQNPPQSNYPSAAPVNQAGYPSPTPPPVQQQQYEPPSSQSQVSYPPANGPQATQQPLPPPSQPPQPPQPQQPPPPRPPSGPQQQPQYPNSGSASYNGHDSSYPQQQQQQPPSAYMPPPPVSPSRTQPPLPKQPTQPPMAQSPTGQLPPPGPIPPPTSYPPQQPSGPAPPPQGSYYPSQARMPSYAPPPSGVGAQQGPAPGQLPPMPRQPGPPPPTGVPSAQPVNSWPPPPTQTDYRSAPTSQPHYPAPQPQPQQRLDPDAMPSVVQVIKDDLEKFDSSTHILYTTSIPSSVPPLVTTVKPGQSYIQDGGCARPNHMRCSIYQIPVSESTLKTTSIPLSCVIKPFDEDEAEANIVVPVTPSEIVRCNRCKAYMNPYMRFIDGGRRFQCSLCRHISDVSPSYFAHLDHTGQRLDKYERPELQYGSYEFKCTDEYCRNSIRNCRRPHIIFGFELTKASKQMLSHIVSQLPEIIKNHLPTDPLCPGSPPPMIGFLTYNSKIEFYDVKNGGRAHVLSDVGSVFPAFTSFLADPVTHMAEIEKFLQLIPYLCGDDELETETILGPVIEAALQTCMVDINNWFPDCDEKFIREQLNSETKPIPVGKVYLFHCTLPTYGSDATTPGRLKPRWTTAPEEMRKHLGTDKEKTVLTPEPSKYYNNLGQRCVTDYGSGVELFLFPPANGPYLDVATLSELVRLTGTGAIYKYFNDSSDNFLQDLKYSLKSTFAFDAIMKVRTSTGIRAHDYLGNYYQRTTSDIELATINTGANIAVEMQYDDKLSEEELVVIQVAILYTAVSGERRVRIHNIALQTCSQVADVYRYACCDTVVNHLIRHAIGLLRSGEKTPQQVKEMLINRVVQILTAYRKHCAQPGSSLGQLILPEALKLLPVYLTGALKCDAIDGGPEMMVDDKALAQLRLLGAHPSLSQVTLYPKLLCIQYESDGTSLRATQIRDSVMRLNDPSALAYVLENGHYIFIYLPTAIPPQSQPHQQFLSAVFGPNVSSPQQIAVEAGLPQLLTPESQYINSLIQSLNDERRRVMKVYIIRQAMDKLEAVFKTFLYEDKKLPAISAANKMDVPSYVDLLCHLHKEIRANLG